MPKKIFIATTVLTALVIIFALFNTNQTQAQSKMGTLVEITLNGPVWVDYNKIFKKAFLAIDKVEDLADRYNENSQLSIVNREGFKHPVKVDEELFYLIEQAINISKDTEGSFDITVAPLVKLWGFYKKQGGLPSEDTIKEALQAAGYDNIVLNKKDRSVYFKKDGVEIDLSAIAKGYAVDKAVEVIKQFGISSAIINAGGDVYCLGKKNIFQKWNVGIRDPMHNKKITKIIHVKDKAVATSGGYEKFFVYKGKGYSHLIDPRTGEPAQAPCNATVVAKNCTQADALATALCIIGKEKLDYLKEKYNIEAYMF